MQGSKMCAVMYDSKESLEAFLRDLKLKQCPFCKQLGTLNRHGELNCVDASDRTQKTERAYRVYCSNRNRSVGCGRTFSVRLANRVNRSALTSSRLWVFFKLVAQDGNKAAAFRSLHCDLSDTTPYRIWRRFLLAQTRIRSLLLSLCQPPRSNATEPAESTLAHLLAAFPDHPDDPIAAFQAKLQVSFL